MRQKSQSRFKIALTVGRSLSDILILTYEEILSNAILADSYWEVDLGFLWNG